MKWIKILVMFLVVGVGLIGTAKLVRAGGGGVGCGANCFCMNQISQPSCLPGSEVCRTINAGTGADGTAYWGGSCGAGRGTSSQDYTCFNGPCGGGGGSSNGCDGGWVTECKQGSNCGGGTRGGQCDTINGIAYYDCTYCSCRSSSPTAVTLSSPADGANTAGSSVNLLWNAETNWGRACTNANNQYLVNVGTVNPPTTTIASIPSGTTTTTFVGTPGVKYYWDVVVNNGQWTATSAVWSFTIVSNQIQGTVYNDPNNTCSQATPWSGGRV